LARQGIYFSWHRRAGLAFFFPPLSTERFLEWAHLTFFFFARFLEYDESPLLPEGLDRLTGGMSDPFNRTALPFIAGFS